MEEVQRTYIDSNSNPWGGSAWGAGIGGLIGSWIGNGGFGWAIIVEIIQQSVMIQAQSTQFRNN